MAKRGGTWQKNKRDFGPRIPCLDRTSAQVYLNTIASQPDVMLDHLRRHCRELNFELTDETESVAVWAMSGPQSRRILERVVDVMEDCLGARIGGTSCEKVPTGVWAS